MSDICPHCDEEITGDDFDFSTANKIRFHLNCFLRGIIGSVAHIEKRCSCFVPGSDEADPPGMTKRQAAEAAVKLYYQKAGTL